ncbi:MAG: hypothetical protein K0R73_1436 [Candidatus Midichloriaceae bacterium]|nr:hypothetical protein [Candidatus Midichloriaceae bacterium]
MNLAIFTVGVTIGGVLMLTQNNIGSMSKLICASTSALCSTCIAAGLFSNRALLDQALITITASASTALILPKIIENIGLAK